MRQAIRKYQRDAEKRGHSFELTEKQFSELTQQDCYYCGAKPNNIVNQKKSNGSYTYNGIDRVDNTKGYTIDNVVPCCKQCNQAKSNQTLQDFFNWGKRFYNKSLRE